MYAETDGALMIALGGWLLIASMRWEFAPGHGLASLVEDIP